MSWTPVGTIKSQTISRHHYTISQREDGHLGCECLSYRFKKGDKTCKHIVAYIGGENKAFAPVKKSTVVKVTKPEEVTISGETFVIERLLVLA